MDAVLCDCIGKDFQRGEYEITKCALMRIRICLIPMQDIGCLGADGLGMLVPSHGPPYHLIYLLLIFFLGALKATLYETAVYSDIDMVERFAIAAATVRGELPFENVRQSMRRRCHACISANERHYDFEHLL
ncbi:hypothetical protein AVEN_214487-1 [Araneus ventricosus]|uniref:Uncharacterized protein n=1 Tax=Araneus ventricosus TaxID=182803 RepID=A0A4Y2CVN0_ARAVE|nr:hypothetical protein AVEN_214487-1 [Araneus ventricosus]